MLPLCTRALAAPLVAGHQDDGAIFDLRLSNRKAHASAAASMAYADRFEMAWEFPRGAQQEETAHRPRAGAD
jgi:hypothetical protein